MEEQLSFLLEIHSLIILSKNIKTILEKLCQFFSDKLRILILWRIMYVAMHEHLTTETEKSPNFHSYFHEQQYKVC